MRSGTKLKLEQCHTCSETETGAQKGNGSVTKNSHVLVFSSILYRLRETQVELKEKDWKENLLCLQRETERSENMMGLYKVYTDVSLSTLWLSAVM
jgi:hypothetical protein